MVSATDALNLAIRDGVLERKVRPARIITQKRWTKKHFVLTPTTWMYFDSLTSSEPGNSLATMEIISVVKSETDIHHRVFTIVLFKKKKEYRAKSTEERDAWVEALESVAGMKGTGEAVVVKRKNSQSTVEERPATEADSREVTETANNAVGSKDVKDLDLRTLCDQMKKSFSWQVQINKSFSSKDVAEFVKKTLPQLSSHQIQEVGQGLIDQKLIIPLKSHVFDEKDPGRFKFVEVVVPKQPKNHMNMRGPSIANLMGNEQFNARKRTMHVLKGVALEAPPEKAVQPHFRAVDKKAEERKQNMVLDEFIRDLEVYLNERNYGQFTNHMLEYKQKQTQGIESATEEQQAKIDKLRHLLVEKLVDEFNASLQTSERMHKKENHLEFLIQLGETQLATEMCLQNYSVRIALQLRHVPSLAEVHDVVVWEADELMNAAIWDKLVSIGVKRCGQSLLKMSFNWQDVDLTDENLPDTSIPTETSIKSLFADVVVKELAEMTNQQLSKAVQNYNPVRVTEAVPNGEEEDGAADARGSFPSMVLGALLQEMLSDEAWWQGFGGKGGAARKRLGYGGVNKFLAEINLLRDIVPANKFVNVKLREVDEKIVGIYQQLHPGKKDVRAPTDWTQAYAKKCIAKASSSTR
ncbi:hypothetical protein BBO99_00000712 [Phytophthora kernoviae]|uniref:Exocyst complex component 8 n=2 Tax=Phytophthora kernoviae TaxID=325452 RepID=A0A3R7JZ30_9STRA|nr:hypothetical protein G195_003204 [Phytophthora kernoviae 00238/432]KAG2524668.1 hypothetical protein JM16_004530 [Phytophthora kernoviae]KAG2525983.1 hypothetical protein JM18_004494 [Phytophthora kernoviae]RLN27365.1 hypothetical protein BBI17_002744 [Phytophthora kernoviae]RLN85255.1 hypothetical protein BBO99_00000712 [Phytophthora kernoviae]